MSESPTSFRTVMRGYDPIQVDRRLSELAADSGAANLQIADLQRRVDELTDAVRSARQQATEATEAAQVPAPVLAPVAPTFEHFGQRIGQIMRLAEEEAADLRAAVEIEAEAKIAAIEAMNTRRRIETDDHINMIKTSAEREAERLIIEARRTVEQLIDDAERQASARRHEADSVYEAQRAQSAQAAADVEQALADRRNAAERIIVERTADAEREIASAQEHALKVRADADQASADATREAAIVSAQAQAKADQIVADAVERAARIRADAEREVAAAAQRRDSINAQLANVRTVLATMSATVPAEPSFESGYESAFGSELESALTASTYPVATSDALTPLSVSDDDPFGPITNSADYLSGSSPFEPVGTTQHSDPVAGEAAETGPELGHRIAS